MRFEIPSVLLFKNFLSKKFAFFLFFPQKEKARRRLREGERVFFCFLGSGCLTAVGLNWLALKAGRIYGV